MTRYLAFGLLFGFILSRVDATSYDAIAQMFLLEDLHVMGVIGVAVIVAGIGLRVLRRQRGPLPQVTIQPKPRKAGNLIGGLLFGAGWALTGTCPGTGLAQLGELQIMAVFTVAGVFAGTALYRRLGPSSCAGSSGGSKIQKRPKVTPAGSVF